MKMTNGTTYKVVFNGELAFDTDEQEAKANLVEKCRYQPAVAERFFSGSKVVIRKNLDAEAANRCKNYFSQIGILVDIVDENPPPPPQPEYDPPPVSRTIVNQGRTCPKCQAENQPGEICDVCGLIFARFETAQSRRYSQEEPQGGGQFGHNENDSGDYLERHPEQLFLLKALGVIIVLLLLQNVLRDFLPIFILIFPIGFFAYIRLQAAASGESTMQLLRQHITFMPVMYAKEERKQQYVAKATYILILINLLVFYLFQLTAPEQFIANNLIFLPLEPNAVNVPLSLLSALFLHGGHGHLWGNMLFLWAVGTVVERRIGTIRFVIFYLLSGIAGNLLYLASCAAIGNPAHILGASGAISGVMGLFAVRCYFKSMTFPLPILGIFSLIFPVSLKVTLNSLVIIGLFVLADLGGGLEQIQGTSHSNIGHFAHLGGVIAGILLAFLFKMNEEAVLERHLELGSDAVGAKIGSGSTQKGEESLRQLLKKDPQNSAAQLLLARLLSKFGASDEGRKLYQQVLPTLVQENPEEAMIAYHEYTRLYHEQLAPDTLYRLATIYHRHQDPDMATHCLERVCQNDQTQPLILEKSLFQCGRILESQQLYDAAADYYQRCIDRFPTSSLGQKAQVRLNQMSTEASPAVV